MLLEYVAYIWNKFTHNGFVGILNMYFFFLILEALKDI